MTIDRMKGIGILLMVLGHCAIPLILNKAIFAFHMPLFFIVSGYLYKEKTIRNVISRNFKKILIPYFITIAIVTPICLLRYGNDWILTILFTKNVPSICGYDWRGYIGPLWFLLAFFNTALFFNIIKRIKCEVTEIIVLLVVFEAAWIFYSINNSILPFQLFQTTGCAIFMYLGLLIKEHLEINKNRNKYIILSVICFIPIVYFGQLSMASFEYRLNILQFIGGVCGTYLLYALIHNFKSKKLALLGRNSLCLMCCHSIDYFSMGGAKIASLLCNSGLEFYFIIEFLTHTIIMIVLATIMYKIKILRNAFSMSLA